uniref:Uncharacterized protein n=1 Tax=Ciona savignyi TaxID=51511 RepID=H2Z7E8_CIOSA
MQEKSHRKLFQGLAFGIDGLSVDWITNNVYWTDTDTKWIMVGNEDISIYTHVVPIASKVPSIVAVDPLTRTIYWSEVDTAESRLLKCGMDGKNVVTLQTFTDVVSIDSLIFDVIGKRLFWGERIPSTVVGQSYTGRVRSMSSTNSSDIKIEHTAINSRFMGISSLQGFSLHRKQPTKLGVCYE